MKIVKLPKAIRRLRELVADLGTELNGNDSKLTEAKRNRLSTFRDDLTAALNAWDKSSEQ